MLRLATTLQTLTLLTVTGLRARLARDDAERGSVTLEQVVIALGLFLVGIAVVGGITAAVNGRLAQIN